MAAAGATGSRGHGGEPSHSGWASPVALTPKKDGGHRFYVDFQKVNACTETDAYPIANINEI